MGRTIQQSVTFRASPAELYEIYMDSRKHSEATGGKASISRRPGGRFSAFGGGLTGRTLVVAPGRLIVQTWRSGGWKKSVPDSILILTFSGARGGGRVDLVHANVPEGDYAGIKDGWGRYYWKPWRAYLKRRGKA